MMTILDKLMARLAERRRRADMVRILDRSAPAQRPRAGLVFDEYGAPEGAFGRFTADLPVRILETAEPH